MTRGSCSKLPRIGPSSTLITARVGLGDVMTKDQEGVSVYFRDCFRKLLIEYKPWKYAQLMQKMWVFYFFDLPKKMSVNRNFFAKMGILFFLTYLLLFYLKMSVKQTQKNKTRDRVILFYFFIFFLPARPFFQKHP